MKNSSLNLYLEINEINLNFFVGTNDDQNNLKIIFKQSILSNELEENKISNFEKINQIIKNNIYTIEQKYNFTFKEIILILDNFNPSFINLSGYKKLNGSQILKENITYILNSLKSYVSKIEVKKNILHIFNSKYYLDNQKIENLPIGLFGDFYSHELSFIMLNINDYKNLKNIFDKCNLKIKKILLKNFVVGAQICENNQNIDTFFHIRVGKSKSKIFYFENSSLKFEQGFNFGSDIIIKDISKITLLKETTIKEILQKIKLKNNFSENEILEVEFFKDEDFRKVKKKLLYEIILARVNEISDILLYKNVNLKYYIKSLKTLFFDVNKDDEFFCLREVFKEVLLNNWNSDLEFFFTDSNKDMLSTVDKLVHFGWKKEAIPISLEKKSLITKVFEAIFK